MWLKGKDLIVAETWCTVCQLSLESRWCPFNTEQTWLWSNKKIPKTMEGRNHVLLNVSAENGIIFGVAHHTIYIPKLAIVFRSVMYVPPIAGSLIFAWNAIWATNMQYTVTYNKIRETIWICATSFLVLISYVVWLRSHPRDFWLVLFTWLLFDALQ